MSSETNTNSSLEVDQRLIKSKRCMLLCLFLYVLLPIPILISRSMAMSKKCSSWCNNQWVDEIGLFLYSLYPLIVFYCLIEIVLTYRYALNKIGIQAFFRACWERVLDLILKFLIKCAYLNGSVAKFKGNCFLRIAA